MNSIKITVIKKFSPVDIIGSEFIRPESGKPITPCYFQEGQEFNVSEMGDMPQDFCHHVWYGIYKEVSILMNGGGYSDWTGKDTIYSTCPDGIRPVIFKLERISS
ncbi:MAG: TIGR04076 family protein [Promethearchaeota archaeon]